MLKAAAPWLSLIAVVAAFLAYLSWLQPADWFGRYHDDTIYFSSAKALAEGRGYIIPSLPGTPPQTKYPVLYPWLLSWIWKWNPSFPANVGAATWVTALFACMFLLAAFCLLRGLSGLGDWPAVVLTGLCAFHSIFLYLSGAVLSDMPFAALALAAAVSADAALRPHGRAWRLWAAAALAGLSLMTRSLGVGVIAGIVAIAVHRRLYRQAVIFCLAAAPFVAAVLWRSGAPVTTGAWGPETEALPGWRQTWLFYTSHWQFWKLSVPDVDVFLSMVAANARYFMERPSTYCLFPPPGAGTSQAGLILGVTLTVGILAGIVRQARRQEWKPIHAIFPVYSAFTLLWNYALMDRFLLLFLPLFYAGLWVEAGHLSSILLRSLRSGRPLSEKVAAGVLAAGFVVVAGVAVQHYLWPSAPSPSRAIAAGAPALPDRLQLYDWIRSETDPATRFVAYEDVSLYLYTGRQAMRPMAFSTRAFYQDDEKVLERDLARITDVARSIGAQYWVVEQDDFSQETGLPLIRKRMAELTPVLPVVFRSRQDKVRLHDLSCLHHPERTACGEAVPVLFPPGTGPVSGHPRR